MQSGTRPIKLQSGDLWAFLFIPGGVYDDPQCWSVRWDMYTHYKCCKVVRLLVIKNRDSVLDCLSDVYRFFYRCVFVDTAGGN